MPFYRNYYYPEKSNLRTRRWRHGSAHIVFSSTASTYFKYQASAAFVSRTPPRPFYLHNQTHAVRLRERRGASRTIHHLGAFPLSASSSKRTRSSSRIEAPSSSISFRPFMFPSARDSDSGPVPRRFASCALEISSLTTSCPPCLSDR
jgi:hypothetical protein